MVSIDWNIWYNEVNVYPGSQTFGYMSDYHHKQKVSDSKYTNYLIIIYYISFNHT